LEVLVLSVSNSYLSGWTKRFLDLFLVAILGLPALVLILMGAVWLWLHGNRSVWYRQVRVGRLGRPFTLYKLRTLAPEHNDQSGTLHYEDEILKAGRLLREWRLDELPQIWNILIGEMSWVGPRPEMPVYYEQICSTEPRFSQRQEALPGLTGLSQIKNPNLTANQFQEKLPDDLEYIRNASLMLDLSILAKTLGTFRRFNQSSQKDPK
jgi:lipopolysaccharide/colanic/teichoic acid biosynthesis glycosyltransferase